MRKAWIVPIGSVFLLAVGCAQTASLYSWGHYEELVYQMYAEPGTADPGTQIAKLNEDIQRAHDAGLRVAPGVHAHLGFMYYLQDNVEAAFQHFEAEKALFPESAVLMDRLLGQGGSQ